MPIPPYLQRTLLHAGLGAAGGAGLGALTADKDQRLKGALRGAAIGGLMGGGTSYLANRSAAGRISGLKNNLSAVQSTAQQWKQDAAKAHADWQAMRTGRDQAMKDLRSLQTAHGGLQNELNSLQQAHAGLLDVQNQYGVLQNRHNALDAAYQDLSGRYTTLERANAPRSLINKRTPEQEAAGRAEAANSLRDYLARQQKTPQQINNVLVQKRRSSPPTQDAAPMGPGTFEFNASPSHSPPISPTQPVNLRVTQGGRVVTASFEPWHGAVLGGLGNAALSGAVTYGDMRRDGEDIDWDRVIRNASIGGIAGAVGGYGLGRSAQGAGHDAGYREGYDAHARVFNEELPARLFQAALGSLSA